MVYFTFQRLCPPVFLTKIFVRLLQLQFIIACYEAVITPRHANINYNVRETRIRGARWTIPIVMQSTFERISSHSILTTPRNMRRGN